MSRAFLKRSGPLSGVLVIEMCQMVSGPMGAMMLADQGANVIKIEAANGVGDRFRGVSGAKPSSTPASFAFANRGKRSLSLNTKSPKGLQALKKLLMKADVFIQNMRPGVMERMGLGYEEISKLNPKLIYVSISGMGPSGPYSKQMVYDFVIQALSGMADFESQDKQGDQVEMVQNIVIDKITSLNVSNAVNAALFARANNGNGSGQHVMINMLDVGTHFMGIENSVAGVIDHPERKETDSSIPSAGPFKTKDGAFVLNLRTRSTWKRVLNAFHDLPWATKYANPDFRNKNFKQFFEEAKTSFVNLTTDECIKRIVKNDLPGSAVLPWDKVHLNEQIQHVSKLLFP